MVVSEERKQRQVSRRTVARGAVWAIPAVPLVVAAPAYAESGGPPTGQFLDACKQPGASCNRDYSFVKGYTFTFKICNNTADTIYIYPTINNVDNPDSAAPADKLNPVFRLASSPPKTFAYETARKFTGGAIGAPLSAAEPIAPGTCLTIIINTRINSDSSNISGSGAIYLAWGHTATVGADPDHSYVPVPPSTTVGEGWLMIPISFTETPPCGTDCAPGGDTSEP